MTLCHNIIFTLLCLSSALKAEPSPSYHWEKHIRRGVESSLYHFHPTLDKWLVLSIHGQYFHLDNPDIHTKVQLYKNGLRFLSMASGKLQVSDCALWFGQNSVFLSPSFKNQISPYYSLCSGRIYVRQRRSSNTNLSLTEWGTQVLRDTSFGEDIINQFKPFLVTLGAEQVSDSLTEELEKEETKAPKSAEMEGVSHKVKAQDTNLGIALANGQKDLYLGRFQETKFYPEAYISLFEPGLAASKLTHEIKDLIYPLTEGEKSKLVYIAAYDLAKTTATFVLGTEEPPLFPPEKDTHLWHKNLVPIGSIPPYDMNQGLAVFIGGFKRHHGVFLGGKYKGKEYGYVEGGVELKKLASGLATLIAKDDEEIDILAWPSDEQAKNLLPHVISARQNGVLLLEDGKPTEFVKDWRSSNWAASAEGLRFTLRAGVCIQESERGRYLLFMAFTQATPSAMALTMTAYHCKSGMHLDMNALMYLHNALYRLGEDNKPEVQYLNKEMLYPAGLKMHRYIMDNNYRDFFYVRRK